MGKPKPPPPDRPASPFHNPFGGLAERLGVTPGPSAAEPAATGAAAQPSPPARAVLRLERKGRGGKEATVVEKLGLAPDRLEAWLGDMRRALGCGGSVEEGAIVLHGDQRARAKAWLEARGVRRISVG